MRLTSTSRRLLCAALAAAWCLGAQAQTPPGGDVASLLAFARENNPDFAGMRHEAAAAAERIAPAGALPDPRLRTELMDITRSGAQDASLLPGRVGSTRYTLMQELPWFGKRSLKREIAELEAESARGRAYGTWNEVAAKIKTTYAQLYYVAENEKLSREILALMLRLEQIAQVRYAGGLAAQQDVIRAQLEQTAMRNELIGIETEHHHLMVRMNALLGRAADAPLVMPASLRPLPDPARLDYAALEERARTRNPLLSAEEQRIQAAEKSRELAYKNRYPDFTAGVAPNQMRNEVRQWDLMLEINIPLQQASRRAQEREAEAMVSASRARRDAAANQLLAELSTNLSELEAARRSEKLAAGSLLPQAELGFKAALAGYETGKVDFAALLDAQRQIRLARLNQIKSRAEAQVRLAEIERILGEDL